MKVIPETLVHNKFDIHVLNYDVAVHIGTLYNKFRLIYRI